jgi:hypothetical protein
MNFVKACFVAAMSCAAAPLSAQSILDEPRQTFDLATVTCKQLMSMPTAGMGIRIIYWLDGYYREEDDPAVIDTDLVKKKLLALAEYCEKNESHDVATAAEALFAKKK